MAEVTSPTSAPVTPFPAGETPASPGEAPPTWRALPHLQGRKPGALSRASILRRGPGNTARRGESSPVRPHSSGGHCLRHVPLSPVHSLRSGHSGLVRKAPRSSRVLSDYFFCLESSCPSLPGSSRHHLDPSAPSPRSPHFVWQPRRGSVALGVHRAPL